ncbi:MAG: serine hydrolase, partial [Bryobacterales bacterium]|nr:serine hydrolase [Bryobacterales bacterium]
AEVASGKPWNVLFQERMAGPLGMEETGFPNGEANSNPQVSAGARSSADDYLRFLKMIRNRGTLDGQRVLSRQAVALLLADQTAGTPIRGTLYSPHESFRVGASLNRYGFGNWLEGMQDGLADANSGQGSFGVSPYLDRRRDLVFLAFLRDAMGTFPRYYYEIQGFLNAAYPLAEETKVSVPVRRTATAGESVREWFEYVPSACIPQETQCPLLVALHPNGQDPFVFAQSTGLPQLAEKEGFVVALPLAASTGDPHPSDPSSSLGMSTTTDEPDEDPDHEGPEHEDPDHEEAEHGQVETVLDIINLVAQSHPVDRERIYLAGFREGAHLAQRIVCSHAQRFAAFAAVRPTYNAAASACEPKEATAAFFYDPPAPDPELPGDSPADAMSFWVARDRCLDSRNWQPLPPSTLTYTDAYGCWPNAVLRAVRSTSTSSSWPDAGWALAWEFLRSHHRPALRPGRFVATSAANYVRRVSAPGALVSLFGVDLAPGTAFAESAPLPLVLAGIRVDVRDRRGLVREARIALVSPLQINLVLPDDLAAGPVSLYVYRDGECTHRDWMVLDPLAPAVFSATATGDGAPAGEILYVLPDGSRRSEWLSQDPGIPTEAGAQPRPIDLTGQGTAVYVTLYGTGWRLAADGEEPVVVVGGVPVQPVYAGAQGQFEGLDQINLRLDGLPLAGGKQAIRVRTGGYESTQLQLLLLVSPPSED